MECGQGSLGGRMRVCPFLSHIEFDRNGQQQYICTEICLGDRCELWDWKRQRCSLRKSYWENPIKRLIRRIKTDRYIKRLRNRRNNKYKQEDTNGE